ncbi:hypothetical protein H112_05954 [Trichophyton rubrum D6]|uniref:DUF6590 domain-containing protein n=2 Tax=Trichophyton TaxID=5550 RepID=A0A022VX89_TRIRU|nr:hypothetical protein H100_05969 [Trichophyton rubrum MR850]EZF39996.1 hypothetical protein H102_05938 [Trichophyton rubrum CBS 100081]EZF50631.1 hypothetical protein H103_05964 [Trichophyton rubrum CBS 288.86]EZF61084.1 hypothetical protein H104_05951 [Trichophyton rubrum CBS 289.86]EZF71856.1 hypothetical protein H105_05978 [Trichophyton soudanense CBS 452.61]EZF82554.1 hypothetical protein H110_05960 [Trichophyton rubrum MR1448]EZF93226.1 hypothetical protein H113_06007 [Trichophyton rub
MPQRPNQLRPPAEYPSRQEPYYSQSYRGTEPLSQDGLVNSPSNYEEDISENPSTVRLSIDSGYHGDSSGFPIYQNSSQRQRPTAWAHSTQTSLSYPSPTPSQYDHGTWQSPSDTNRRFSNPTYQGNNYELISSPYGLQRAYSAKDYKVQPTQFYSIGRVISVYWAEPAGDTSVPHSHGSPYFYSAGYGQEVHANIRRMVVVNNQQGCSWCLAIYTYGGRGLLKPGIDLNTHSVVYMRGSEPAYYAPGREAGIPPIMINPFTPEDKLQESSCLNFGKVFTVDHNIKVKPIGHVSQESLRLFHRAWRQCLDNEDYGN